MRKYLKPILLIAGALSLSACAIVPPQAAYVGPRYEYVRPAPTYYYGPPPGYYGGGGWHHHRHWD